MALLFLANTRETLRVAKSSPSGVASLPRRLGPYTETTVDAPHAPVDQVYRPI
eukprot:COSAG01_NODE_45956_length_404_cov_2.377049_1_plen_52_part_01